VTAAVASINEDKSTAVLQPFVHFFAKCPEFVHAAERAGTYLALSRDNLLHGALVKGDTLKVDLTLAADGTLQASLSKLLKLSRGRRSCAELLELLRTATSQDSQVDFDLLEKLLGVETASAQVVAAIVGAICTVLSNHSQRFVARRLQRIIISSGFVKPEGSLCSNVPSFSPDDVVAVGNMLGILCRTCVDDARLLVHATSQVSNNNINENN
jgi:hypothetical protein